jgi:hypothetical protein
LSAKCGRNIAALAALQQHDHDDEETDQDVNSGDQIDHKFDVFLSSTANRLNPDSLGFPEASYGAEGGT